MSAFKAAEDSRRLTLPQKSEDYATALPKDFKGPEGVEIKFKEDSPLLAQAKAWALKNQVSQEGYSEVLALYAAAQIQAGQDFETAKTAEFGKLGAAAQGRVDAVVTFANAMVGEEHGKVIKDSLFTADQVKAWEALMQKFQSQGVSPFSQQHREQQTNGKATDEQYAKMSFSEKMDYARQHGQRTN